MNQHGDSVGAEAHVDLDAIATELERPPDAEQGVFWGMTHRCPVCNDQRVIVRHRIEIPASIG